ncbi:MAG: extracellular solute-binding protein [Acetatifactor sp.]|nr:extracellular solute-binding protein [Acetatifactor sp.]
MNRWKKGAVGVLLSVTVLLSGCGANDGNGGSGSGDGSPGIKAPVVTRTPELGSANPTKDFYVLEQQKLTVPAADLGEQGWREGTVLAGDEIFHFYRSLTGLDINLKWYRISAEDIFTDTYLTGAYPVVTTQEAAVELPLLGDMGPLDFGVECGTAFFTDASDILYLLTEIYDLDDEVIRRNLYQCDREGQVLEQKDLTEALAEVPRNRMVMPNYMLCHFGAMDGAGNVYLTYAKINKEPDNSTGQTADRIWVVDADGQLRGTVPLEGREVTALVSGADGVVYGADSSGNTIFAVDGEAGSLEDVLTVPESQGNLCLAAEAEGMLLYVDKNALYSCDPTEGTSEQLLLWEDFDISGRDVCAVERISDDRLLVLDTNGNLYSLALVDAGTLPANRLKVVLGVITADDDLKAAVTEFNLRNYYYEVEIKEYGAENGRQLLTNDIVSGKGPDMVDINVVYVDEFLQKGLLADMSPYLEDGRGLERADLMESVLRCNTMDGVLVCIPTSFYIDTLVGRASLLGSEPGWNLEEYMAFVEANRGKEVAEGSHFSFSEIDSRAIIPLLVLRGDIGAFVDWETGTAGFDNEEFQEVMQLAAGYRSNARDISSGIKEFGVSTLERMQDGSVLLYYQSIGSVNEYLNIQAALSEDTIYIGYPTMDGKPYSGMVGRENYAILADSPVKDGAWVFQEFLLTANKGDKVINSGFPTRVRVLEYQLEKAMIKSYQRDNAGNLLLDESGNPVEQPKRRQDRWEVYAATPEDVEQIMSLIDSLSFSSNTWIGNQIYRIAEEELLMCMSGDRSVKATIDVIQNRVQLYLDENG